MQWASLSGWTAGLALVAVLFVQIWRSIRESRSRPRRCVRCWGCCRWVLGTGYWGRIQLSADNIHLVASIYGELIEDCECGSSEVSDSRQQTAAPSLHTLLYCCAAGAIVYSVYSCIVVYKQQQQSEKSVRPASLFSPRIPLQPHFPQAPLSRTRMHIVGLASSLRKASCSTGLASSRPKNLTKNN